MAYLRSYQNPPKRIGMSGVRTRDVPPIHWDSDMGDDEGATNIGAGMTQGVGVQVASEPPGMLEQAWNSVKGVVSGAASGVSQFVAPKKDYTPYLIAGGVGVVALLLYLRK